MMSSNSVKSDNSAGPCQNLTESREIGVNSGNLKIQKTMDTPNSTNTRKKRKKKGHKSIPSDGNSVAAVAKCSSSTHNAPPSKAAKESPCLSDELYRPSTNMVPQTSDPVKPADIGVAHKRKERQKKCPSKKTPEATENRFQVPVPHPLMDMKIPHSFNDKGNYLNCHPIQPFPGAKTNIPAGVLPMNYLRGSPVVAKETPKQEKFSPYWPDKDVEDGLTSGALIKGPVRINPRNYQKAYISVNDGEDAKDILIDGIMDRNRALEGDEVAVKLYDESKWQTEEDASGEKVIQKTGMVVSILEKRHHRRTVGYLKLVQKPAKNSPPSKGGRNSATPNKSGSNSPATPSSSTKNSSKHSARKSVHNRVKENVQVTSPACSETPTKPVSTPESKQSTAPLMLSQTEVDPICSNENEQLSGLPAFLESPVTPSETPVGNQIFGTSEPHDSDLKINVESTPVLPKPNASNCQPNPEPIHGPCSQGTPASPKEPSTVSFKMPDKVLFSPRDARMPRMWVKTSSLPSGTPVSLNPSNCQNHLFLACINEWNEQPIAIGNLLGYVGEADEVDSETTALLLEHDLDVTPFPEDKLKLPPLPYQIPQKELAERVDLRKTCIFTIDPPTAKDLDDALSVAEIGDDRLEIGVHIADPTFFLEEGSDLDLFVRRRATSIYLVQNVYHMLPKDLCMLCSLLPGEDKLAFSLTMEVCTKTWTVVSHKFFRSVINSCAQLAYDHAQAFIDNPDGEWSSEDFPPVHNGYTIKDLSNAVNLIRPFAAVLRERRFSFHEDAIESGDDIGIQGGALKINQPKLCFKLDHETCMPQEVFVYENKESHRLIEELMLMANILTAQKLASAYPNHAFLRRHSRPKMRMLNNLCTELSHYGIHIDTSAAGALNASLSQYGPIDPGSFCKTRKTSENSDIEDDYAISSSKIPTEAAPSPSKPEVILEFPSHQQIKGEDSDPSELLELVTLKDEENINVVPETTVDDGLSVGLSDLHIRKGVEEGGVGESQGEEAALHEMTNLEVTTAYCEEVSLKLVTPESSRTERVDVLKPGNSKQLHVWKPVPSAPKMPLDEEELAIARSLVLNHLCAKPMVRADYYCLGASIEKTANKNMKWKLDDDKGAHEEEEVYTHHYALNVPLYTHFTSPIRRYADIMVHRLLAASLGYRNPPEVDPMEIQKIATNCNAQNSGAKKASEASNELFFRLWIRLQIEEDKKKGEATALRKHIAVESEESRSEGGIKEAAVVVNVKDYSFDAILIKFGVVVRIYVNKIPAIANNQKKNGTSTISIRWFVPGKKCATRDSPRQEITMFSIVDVMIYYSYSARRIRAELISPFVNTS